MNKKLKYIVHILNPHILINFLHLLLFKNLFVLTFHDKNYDFAFEEKKNCFHENHEIVNYENMARLSKE
jgi:hypothetical protein